MNWQQAFLLSFLLHMLWWWLMMLLCVMGSQWVEDSGNRTKSRPDGVVLVKDTKELHGRKSVCYDKSDWQGPAPRTRQFCVSHVPRDDLARRFVCIQWSGEKGEITMRIIEGDFVSVRMFSSGSSSHVGQLSAPCCQKPDCLWCAVGTIDFFCNVSQRMRVPFYTPCPVSMCDTPAVTWFQVHEFHTLVQVVQWQREGHSTLPLRVRFPASVPGACAGGAGLWRSSFNAHGRDPSCERPPCGYLHLNLATLGQVPNVATSDALVSEASGLGGERALVIGM